MLTLNLTEREARKLLAILADNATSVVLAAVHEKLQRLLQK